MNRVIARLAEAFDNIADEFVQDEVVFFILLIAVFHSLNIEKIVQQVGQTLRFLRHRL